MASSVRILGSEDNQQISSQKSVRTSKDNREKNPEREEKRASRKKKKREFSLIRKQKRKQQREDEDKVKVVLERRGKKDVKARGC